MTTKKLVAALAAQAPGGWTATTGTGPVDLEGLPYRPDFPDRTVRHWVRFERAEGDVRAAVTLQPWTPRGAYDRGNAFAGQCVEGQTTANGCSFTRRGIDCSSCSLTGDPKHIGGHEYGDLASLLAGEWARCVGSVARSKTSEDVPGLPFKRQSEWFGTAAADLRAGKAVTLTPHGFGTGYTLTARKRSAFAKRMQPLAERLGLPAVYAETFDYD